jgi:hypothetical protein
MVQIYIESYVPGFIKDINKRLNNFKNFILDKLTSNNIEEINVFFNNSYLVNEGEEIYVNSPGSIKIETIKFPNLCKAGIYPWILEDMTYDKNELWLNLGFTLETEYICDLDTCIYKPEFTSEIIKFMEYFYKNIGSKFGTYLTIDPGRPMEGILEKNIKKLLSFEAAFIPKDIVSLLKINFVDDLNDYKFKGFNNYFIILKREFWINHSL